MKKISKQTNRLINEKSPYLLQHAHNPVDWFPWGDEAFNLANKLEKPIFLSIGYSTCHWCHVMEKESFEDDKVAKLLNEHFICIKVDKEERPDIDNIYMTIAQITTGSGGWPLNVILTPDKKPFYIDTYIPKYNRFMKLGLIDLIPKLNHLWKHERKKVITSSENIIKILKEEQHPDDSILNHNILKNCFNDLESQFDNTNGGFGKAPKFPSPHNLIFLLRYWKLTGKKQALKMAELTLEKIRNGGIYDHIGKGVHRYSTDSEWLLPHFEKMLYDQALLSLAYTEAFEATGKEIYKKTSQEILDYILRDLTSPDGGFYAGEDADSEGVEGKFYTWKTAELKSILTDEEYTLFTGTFNIKEEGNFHDEATMKKNDLNIPYLSKEMPINISKQIDSIKQKLFQHREARIHPHKDDKILTDWNGLTIAALAKASRIFEEAKYLKAALKALTFISNYLITENFKLLHDYRDNKVSSLSFVDDYAYIIFGLIELYESTFNNDHLKLALRLNNNLIKHFWDVESGGFFFTANYLETVLIRKKEIYDGAIPSGNSISLLNLYKLYLLTNDMKLKTYADQMIQAFSKTINRIPTAYTMFLTGFNYGQNLSCKIIISSPQNDICFKKAINKINAVYIPDRITILTNQDNRINDADEDNYPIIDNKPTFYICNNDSCYPPTTDILKIKELLTTTNI